MLFQIDCPDPVVSKKNIIKAIRIVPRPKSYVFTDKSLRDLETTFLEVDKGSLVYLADDIIRSELRLR
jgi:hypothetical protein